METRISHPPAAVCAGPDFLAVLANQRRAHLIAEATHEAGGEFVAGDPFVLNGVVRHWHIRTWNEVLDPR